MKPPPRRIGFLGTDRGPCGGPWKGFCEGGVIAILYWCVGKKRFWGTMVCLALTLMSGAAVVSARAAQEKKFIRWVDFGPTYSALSAALDRDIASHKEPKEGETPVNWVELLACLGARYGGDFSHYKEAHLRQYAAALSEGKTPEEILGKGPDQYYSYYYEAYGAVLGNMVGEYLVQEPDPQDPEKLIQTQGYGLTAFCPIARGYGYSHYDDFGDGRSYGYRRKHLGNDLLAPVGTPVVAVEGGTVEAAGWNQYGGWRIGIRSNDGKRYYYYAHLRKGHPFAEGIAEGSTVEAGQVIGYVGMTGYSNTPDTNGMTKPHLHFGLQLIFDESQKEGNNEIWVDVYTLVNLLERRRCTVVPGEGAGEYRRKYQLTPLE